MGAIGDCAIDPFLNGDTFELIAETGDRDSKGTVAVELLLFLLRLHQFVVAFDIQQVFTFIDFFCLRNVD